jgi:hypothetical protein
MFANKHGNGAVTERTLKEMTRGREVLRKETPSLPPYVPNIHYRNVRKADRAYGRAENKLPEELHRAPWYLNIKGEHQWVMQLVSNHSYNAATDMDGGKVVAEIPINDIDQFPTDEDIANIMLLAG